VKKLDLQKAVPEIGEKFFAKCHKWLKKNEKYCTSFNEMNVFTQA